MGRGWWKVTPAVAYEQRWEKDRCGRETGSFGSPSPGP